MAAPPGGPEMLIEGLEKAWDASDKLLKRILTSDVETLKQNLQTSPRQSQAFNTNSFKLENALVLYNPQAPVPIPLSVTAILQSIFGTAEITHGSHRPDDILYRTNLAYFVKDILVTYINDENDLDFGNYLEIFSTSLFSQVTPAKKMGIPGDTTIAKATFELALEFRTQAFIGNLIESVHEDSPFDFHGALLQNFNESGVPKGFGIAGLETDDLQQSQLKSVKQRFKQIADAIKNYQDVDPVFERLRSQFPVVDFINQIFFWAKQRDAELSNRVEDVAGGVSQIQDAIDQEIARLHTDTGYDEDNVASTLLAATALAKGKKNALSLPRNQLAGQSTNIDDGNAYTDFGPYDDQDYGIGIGEEGGADQGEMSFVDSGITREEALAFARGARDSEKENLQPSRNLPKRSYLDSQSQGRALTWDESPQSSHQGKGKQRALVDPRLQDNPADDDDEDEGHFETQVAPPAKKRKSTQMAVRPQPRLPAYPTQSTQDFPSGQTRDTPQSTGNMPRSQAYYEANARAKAIARDTAINGPANGQRRVPYSDEEIETFMYYVQTIGISWAKIKKADEAADNILKRRDQVALKDKARNMTMDFLKAGKALPPNFEKVSLKKAEVKKLHDMGIAWPMAAPPEDEGIEQNQNGEEDELA